MKGKSIYKVDLKDGHYSGRLGGKIVSVRTSLTTNIKFEVDWNVYDLSIPVYVVIEDGMAEITNKYGYSKNDSKWEKRKHRPK